MVAVICAWLGRPLGRPRPVVLAAASAPAAGLALPLFSGGGWMPYARLVTPYLPVAVAVLAVAVAALRVPGAVVAAVALPLAVAVAEPHDTPMRDGGIGPLLTNSGFDQVGRDLARNRLSFYAPRRRVLDIFGLTEPDIARRPRSGTVYGKSDLARTLAGCPSVIATNYWPRLGEILARPEARGRGYRAVFSPALTRHRAFLVAAGPDADALVTTMRLHDPDVRMLDVSAALRQWARRVPMGQ